VAVLAGGLVLGVGGPANAASNSCKTVSVNVDLPPYGPQPRDLGELCLTRTPDRSYQASYRAYGDQDYINQVNFDVWCQGKKYPDNGKFDAPWGATAYFSWSPSRLENRNNCSLALWSEKRNQYLKETDRVER
jgi:hypothetical protein